MTRIRTLAAALAALAVAACSQEPAGPGADDGSDAEAQLAAAIETSADSMMRRGGGRPGDLARRFRRAILSSGNAEAIAYLEQADALMDSARASREAGDTAAVRAYLLASQEALCDGAVLVLPDAYERTSALIDEIVARAEERLGSDSAPRIRAVLARVKELRAEAEASAATDEGHALALNLRALAMLRRLREGVRNGGPRDELGAPPMDGDGRGPGGPGGRGGGRGRP